MSVATKNAVTKAEIAPEEYEAELYSLRIYAYTNNQLVGHFAYPNPDQVTSNSNGLMNFYMHVEAHSTSLQQVDFYVIANEEGLQGATFRDNMTAAQLDAMTFNSVAGASNPETMKMPNVTKKSYILDMSGNSNPTASGHEDHTLVNAIYEYDESAADKKGAVVAENKLTFNLERPTAKLRVFAASLDNSSTAKLTIVSAALINNQAPASGFVMPHTTQELKNHRYETINRVEMTLSSDATTKGCKYFDKETADRVDENYYTEVTSRAYYPHEIPFGSEDASEAWKAPTYYDNNGEIVATGGTAKGNVLEIVYRFNDDEPRTGIVYLPPFKRNHYYAIYCLMNNAGQFTIVYDVVDWDHDEDNDWDLKFEYPTYTALYPVGYESLSAALKADPNPFTNPQCWYVENGTGTEGCFQAVFSLTNPSNITIKPALGNVTAGEFNIEIWQNNAKTDKAVFTASSVPYTVVIRPISKITAQKKIKLMFEWTPDWDLTNPILLLINQKPGDVMLWEGSGEESDIIEIDCLTSAPKAGQ